MAREIRCVGEENLTSDDAARALTVAPTHPDAKGSPVAPADTVGSAAEPIP